MSTGTPPAGEDDAAEQEYREQLEELEAEEFEEEEEVEPEEEDEDAKERMRVAIVETFDERNDALSNMKVYRCRRKILGIPVVTVIQLILHSVPLYEYVTSSCKYVCATNSANVGIPIHTVRA